MANEVEKIPKIDGEVLPLEETIDFLSLPKPIITRLNVGPFESYPDLSELDDKAYPSEMEMQDKYKIPNTIVSHHAKMRDHKYMKGLNKSKMEDEDEYDSDDYGDLGW